MNINPSEKLLTHLVVKPLHIIIACKKEEEGVEIACKSSCVIGRSHDTWMAYFVEVI